ncbi:uncharacterized protein F5147DRAFT_692840 [Suillus discolor]|uniref:Major facilitator superfamily (MFS) profile domain-containing protein n=1 Tax=Suillus discolor TaxID=1912936 RepID=A0A9P7F8K2_9AGAM|nr:uncharacterized protein F5147DRAFT_692840 [Suillus discolor]KAG2109336.1 hypothetical protein F5147DRAFT_692840 [Suillus discolor]
MIAQQDDEETPLLQQPEQPKAKTPLPWDQFWIPCLFLKDIGVTHGDETQVGHYVSILVSMSSSFLPFSFKSSYFAAHTLTIFHWSQLSDHIGRRPVILTALLALVISMFAFGLSKSFLALLVRSVFS